MIGNDVVDLLQSRIESNWRRRGFIEKLFTTEEQFLIYDHLNKEIMVWVLWSMKEAAYKIYNRKTGIRGFIPLQLVAAISCKNGNKYTGTVICNGVAYYTKTMIEDTLIHTIAATEVSALDDIKEISGAVIIKNSCGLPFVYGKGGRSLIPVSVSHHGKFYKIVAFAK